MSSGGQPARLDVWSIAAAKGCDGRKRICRACGAQSRATSSVRTKRGRREKASKSNSHSIPFASSREPHIADAAWRVAMRLANSPMPKLQTKLWKAGAKKARSDRRLYQDL